MDDAVRDLNANARRVLEKAHRHAVDRGSHGGLGFPPDFFASTGLEPKQIRAAIDRLILRQLMKRSGGMGCALTDYGMNVAEDPNALDAELPVGPPIETELPQDVVENFGAIVDASLDFMKDADLRRIVERDLEELAGALKGGLFKTVGILCGGILEAVLIDVLERKASIAQSYMGQNKKFPADASLDKLVEIGAGEGLLEPQAVTMVGQVRDFRDLVHPDRERRFKPKVDDATAYAHIALVRLVLRDLTDATAAAKIAAYEAK